MRFGYEDLAVWDRAVDFAVKVIDVVESLESSRKHFRLLEQIEASASSISMNLAEGKGRFSKKEFIHYCYIARGSLYETMTLLEIFKRKNWISDWDFSFLKYFEKTKDGKLILREVMQRYVPAEITRAVKQGFSAPDAS